MPDKRPRSKLALALGEASSARVDLNIGHIRSAGELDRQRPQPLHEFAVTSNDSLSDHARIGKKVLLAIATPPAASPVNAASLEPSGLRVSLPGSPESIIAFPVPIPIPLPSLWSALAANVAKAFLLGLMTMDGGRRLSVVFCAASVINLPGLRIPFGSKSSLIRLQMGYKSPSCCLK